MNQADKKQVAIWVRQARAQRIYPAGIIRYDGHQSPVGTADRKWRNSAREYTLGVLAEKLGVKPECKEPEDNSTSFAQPKVDPTPPCKLNRSRKIILSIGTGLLLVLGTGAYTAQSAHFPETTFEGFLLWMGVTAVYTVTLFKLWK